MDNKNDLARSADVSRNSFAFVAWRCCVDRVYSDCVLKIKGKRSDTMNMLWIRCRNFVEEQSAGEWDDKTIANDADQLMKFIMTETQALRGALPEGGPVGRHARTLPVTPPRPRGPSRRCVPSPPGRRESSPSSGPTAARPSASPRRPAPASRPPRAGSSCL